jgi:hypothetical protein
MKYYVQVFDGKPSGFMMTEENLIQLAYQPDLLIGHPIFYEVIRNERPVFDQSDYKWVSDTPYYEVVENFVHELWKVRDMTVDEISALNTAEKNTALDIVNHLEQQCKDVLSKENISFDIRDFLTNYLGMLSNLSEKENLCIADVAEIKLSVYDLISQ